MVIKGVLMIKIEARSSRVLKTQVKDEWRFWIWGFLAQNVSFTLEWRIDSLGGNVGSNSQLQIITERQVRGDNDGWTRMDTVEMMQWSKKMHD